MTNNPVSSNPHAAPPIRVLAIANQKGGVGKTTTAINLGTALAAIGERVLILDLDPQGNASTGVGVPPEARPRTMYDVLAGHSSIMQAKIDTKIPNLSIVAANSDLVGLESELMGDANRPYRLRDAVTALRAQQSVSFGAGGGVRAFTYILIDCPPSLSLLTLNAMTAANAVLVPVQCEFFALEGISQLKETIDQIKATLNPKLEIQGVVLTMHDQRTAFSREIAENVRSFFGSKVYKTMIPRNIRVAEAPSFGQPILIYDHDCIGSKAYVELASEVIARERAMKAA
ncbi:MAG: AAA family ATPase [Hyphomicrobiaceae bacterium]|nr:ParA family protein [Hyphomicrobiaceae bacterium]